MAHAAGNSRWWPGTGGPRNWDSLLRARGRWGARPLLGSPGGRGPLRGPRRWGGPPAPTPPYLPPNTPRGRSGKVPGARRRKRVLPLGAAAALAALTQSAATPGLPGPEPIPLQTSGAGGGEGVLYLAAAPATTSPPSPPGQHSPRPPRAPRRVGGPATLRPKSCRSRAPAAASRSAPGPPPGKPSPQPRPLLAAAGPNPTSQRRGAGAAPIAPTRAAPGARAVGSRFPPEERQGRLSRVVAL